MVRATVIISMALLLVAPPIEAQIRITEFGAQPVVISDKKPIPHEELRPNVSLYTEHVMGDLHTRAMVVTSFMRKVWRVGDSYQVEVRDGVGTLRMTGSYADPELTERQGEFHYFHPNGRLSAIGKVHEDLKWGEWKRFDRNGSPMPEKHYGLMDPYEMALHFGWIEVACTAQMFNGVQQLNKN